MAESIGFDSVWVIDSQLLCRDVMITLAAILSRTTTLRAATGVTQPVTRHASVTAGAMATLAEMSGGRVILGVGTGFSSLGTIGAPQARIADVTSFVDTTRALLAGHDATFANDVSGRLSWLDQPTGVPIVIAATGPRMTRTAGRIADGVIIHQGLASDAITRALDWVRTGAGAAAMPEISCWAPYALSADPAEARDRVRSRVAGALATAPIDWFGGNERVAVERLKAAYHISDHASPRADHATLVPDSLIPRYALAGDRIQVRAELTRLLDQPGIDRVVINPQITGPGSRPLPDVLREFESQVLAHL